MNERTKELAKQAIANAYFWNVDKEVYEVDHAQLIEFAELVAQQEREACARLCEEGTNMPVQVDALKIIRAERERIAEAIRARSET